MKTTLAIFLVLLPLAVAGQSRTGTPATVDAKKPAAEVRIPAGAVETAPGTFAHTDAQGKKWIYRKTPFGVARAEDKGEVEAPVKPTVAAAKAAEKTTVKDNGDSYHFERRGPFGVYQWDRKKSELNEAERAVVDAQQTQSAARATSQQD